MNDRLPRFRQVRRRVGALVLIAGGIFVIAVLQAGVFRDAFRSTLELRVILPDSGPAGLQSGSAVEILGTEAGAVRAVVLDPEEAFYATLEIDEAMEPFIRRDSEVYIRKQFGIAGAAFLEITRGHGAPLDWDFAVLKAEADDATSESIGAILEDVRARVFPLIDDVGRIVASLDVVTRRLAAGQGTVGRLLAEDAPARDLETALATLNQQLARLDPIMGGLQTASANIAAMSQAIGNEAGALPEMVENTNAALASLNRVMDEVGGTMPELTQLVRETSDATTTLPVLLAQTEQTFAELERLLVQMQGLWLFGGGGTAPADGPSRLSPLEARP